jgi:hypothetical protein
VSKKGVLILLGVCISLILLFVALISALLVYSVANHKQPPEEKASEAEMLKRRQAKGKVVYCLKDIAQGAIIDGKALGEKEIEEAKIPLDAIRSTTLADGRRAKYGMEKGQIISQQDLAPH